MTTTRPHALCRRLVLGSSLAAVAVGTLVVIAHRPAREMTSAATGSARRVGDPMATHEASIPAPESFASRLRRLSDEPPGADRTVHLATLFEAWGAADPTEAARALLALENSDFCTDALEAFVSGWIARHPAAAADWMIGEFAAQRFGWTQLAFRALADRPATLTDLAGQLAARDPAHAASYLEPAVAALAESGSFPSACALAAGAADPQLRDALRETIVDAWAQRDPRAAGTWLLSLPSDPERDGLAGRLAAAWSVSQPQSSAEFAATLPAGLGRTHALTLSLQAWVARDAIAASRWLAALPPAPDLDTPIFALATDPAIAAATPAVAASWAERIANPDVRLQGLRAVLAPWAASDPAAARRFLLTTPALSEDFRRTLLGELGS